MTREEMLTEVIRTRGFEDKWTISMPFDDEDEDE